MLKEKDKIFTNIYGFKDRSLKGVMSRVSGLIQVNYT